MTRVEVKVPSPGESITQVQLASWLVQNGDQVVLDQEIAEIDSDKATLAISAPAAGTILFKAEQGDTLAVGAVLCEIETALAIPPPASAPRSQSTPEKEAIPPVEITPASPEAKPKLSFSPLARKVLGEHGLDEQTVTALLQKHRISRQDAESLLLLQQDSPGSTPPSTAYSRQVERKKMSSLRLRLSERLVAVKNQTAMLTTFNELDMSALLEVKKKYAGPFKEKYGFSPGFMSFFTKAAAMALLEFPMVNSWIEGDELVQPAYVDMGIAVSAPKGLLVPVIRDAQNLSLAEIEATVKELAGKARANKITLEEMSGGTFTITNGGVFGSMMSTPILNPPQSAILGMHAILERPVARDGQVVIRPMMYLALSYDHRLIDGKDSVGFLIRIKELIENPLRMLHAGNDPWMELLGL